MLTAAMLLVLSLSVGVFAACDNTSDAATTKTDTCAIANGNFEYFTDDDDLKLILSPNSWTKSVGTDANGSSAGSSTKASGIVDTESEKWTSVTTPQSGDKEQKAVVFEYAEDGLPNVSKAMKDGKNNWSSMSVYDRLAFYDELEDAIETYNDKKDDDYSMSDFYYYSDYNYEISLDDVPDCANPGTKDGYYSKNSDGTYTLKDGLGENANVLRENVPAEEAETGVLMIHNYRTDGNGTAQKYTSSTTVTLEPNTSARLSVWVKTADMTYGGGASVNGMRGASINVTHTVGGKTLDQMRIKNIDTSSVTDNNGWAQYTIYVKACSYATSTFTVVLGLGEGSSVQSAGYVAGYAFFDDVDLRIISNEDYDKAVKDDTTNDYLVPYCTIDSTAKQKQFKTDEFDYKAIYPEATDNNAYALDLYADLKDFTLAQNDTADAKITTGLTKTKINNTIFTTSNYKGLGIPTDGDIAALTNLSALTSTTGNSYLTAVLEKDFESFPFKQTDDMIFLLSAHGAAYTAKMEATGDLFTLEEDEYMLVSFWVKTSDTTGFTGATVTLYDQANKTALGPYNTTTISPIDIDGQEDVYDGWAQCFFFVQNETNETHDYYLEFSYGPTDLSGKKASDFSEGYAAFTNFTYKTMTATEYDSYAGSASQSTSVSLYGQFSSASSSNGFSATTATDEDTIKENLANAADYTGVKGNDVLLGGDGGRGATNQSDADNATAASAKTAGLINKNYLSAYIENAQTATDHRYDWLKLVLGTKSLSLTQALNDTAGTWSKLFGTSTQPLLIANVVEQSYGYFSSSYNLSASGYSAISLRVMVSSGAKAYIYLIDTTDPWSDAYNDTAEVDTVNVTYWYDDDGNVCMADPTDDEFDARRQTAFYKSVENGLYGNKLNAEDKNVYANLMNYEKDEDGNLIVRTDSSGKPIVTYDYFDGYSDDGIAFYYNEGKYYAYYDKANDAYSTEVKDFSACPDYTEGNKTFTTKYARYLNKDFLESRGVDLADLGENVSVTGLVDTRACIVVNGDDPAVAGKWITVSFYVLTGSRPFSYRLEAFSGSRDGSVKSAQGSFVAFDVCNSSDLSSNYDGLLKEITDDMTSGTYRSPSVDFATGNKTYSNVSLQKNDETDRLEYVDGSAYENADYFCYSFYDDTAYQRYDKSLDERGDGDLYTGYAASDYTETLSYLYYETNNTVAQDPSESPDESVLYCMFLDYSTLSQNVEADSSVSNEAEDETKWWEDSDFWLMLSSIILSAVLIIVLIVVLITKVVRNVSRRSGSYESRYSAKRKRYIRRLNLQTEEETEETDVVAEPASTEESAKAEEPSDDNPYND